MNIRETQQEEARRHAKGFLAHQSAMVLATVSEFGDPEAATVYFVADEEFNLYFLTSAESRKAENLAKGGKAAFVVGTGPEVETIQGAGTASSLDERQAAIFYDLIKKNAFKSVYQWPILELAKTGYRAFKITPLWMTYLNLNKDRYPAFAGPEFYTIV